MNLSLVVAFTLCVGMVLTSVTAAPEGETRLFFAATVTVTTTTNIQCAKFVNVTGACRRRRGFPDEEPIITSFDVSIDDDNLFAPTPPKKVEPTARTLMPAMELPWNWNANPFDVQPSYTQLKQKAETGQFIPRLFFTQIQSLINNILNGQTTTVTTTRTTSTVTYSVCTPAGSTYNVCRRWNRWVTNNHASVTNTNLFKWTYLTY